MDALSTPCVLSLFFQRVAHLTCLACVCGSTAALYAETATWMQWRGPDRNGRFVGQDWPDNLSEASLRESWRVELAESYSGPIVTPDRILTTETRDKTLEVVTCFDRFSGQKLWEQSWQGAMRVPFFAAANGSWIRSTPACDGKTIFVGGMEERLVALDVATGEIRWQIDFQQQLKQGAPAFGFVCSPLLEGDALYVQAGSCCLRLNKQDGTIVWQTDGGPAGMQGGAFSSPILATIRGEQVLVAQSRQELKLLRPADGKELGNQEIEAFRGMNILTPTVVGNAIFTSAHSGQGQLWNITRDEDRFEFAEVWSNRKLEAYMSSPVVVGDFGYLLLRNQRFCCFDVRTGEQRWRTKPFGKYWSLCTDGKKLLTLDERGILLLMRATPDAFDLIDERKISDSPTWAHLAVADEQLVVRELNALVVYHWKQAEAVADSASQP